MTELGKATDANFAEEVLASEQPVLVDFWAPWCGPCLKVAPILEDISATEGIRILKLNVDENPTTAAMYAITSIPTILVFEKGRPVHSIVGAKPKAAILAEIAPYLK